MSSPESCSSMTLPDTIDRQPATALCTQQIDYNNLLETQKKLKLHLTHIQEYISLIDDILQIQLDIKKLKLQEKLKLRLFQLANSQGLSPAAL